MTTAETTAGHTDGSAQLTAEEVVAHEVATDFMDWGCYVRQNREHPRLQEPRVFARFEDYLDSLAAFCRVSWAFAFARAVSASASARAASS